MKYVRIEVSRDAYAPKQLDESDSCTIGQLREWCDDFSDDTVVILSHDDGYTFGGLPIDDCVLGDTEEDDD